MLIILVGILEKMLRLVPVAVFMFVVFRLLVKPEKNLIGTVKRNFRRLTGKDVKYAAVMILICGVFGLAAFGVFYVREKQSASVVIGLNYLQASSGLNPNNTKFTTSELLDDAIMEQVIQKGGYLNVSADELRGRFQVTPLQQEENVSLEQPYIATVYRVRFSTNQDLSFMKPEQVVSLYAVAVEDYFRNTYSRKTNILEMDFSGVEDADYLDIAEILNTEATKLYNYIRGCRAENEVFRSSATGETFRTLSQKILNYKDTSLENYKAFILKNGLSKDRELYIGRLNYDNRIYEMDYKKNLSVYQVNLNCIDMYERDMATIVLVPTRDVNGEFYMSRTKIGVDDFSRDADEASASAASLLKEISNNNYIISQLQSGNGSGAMTSEAERLIITLKDDLSNLAQISLQTVEEYDRQQSVNYITSGFTEKKDAIWKCIGKSVSIAGKLLVAIFFLLLLKPERTVRRVEGAR